MAVSAVGSVRRGLSGADLSGMAAVMTATAKIAAAPASAYPSGPRCQVKVSLNLG